MLTLRGHSGAVVGLAYSPDARLLASASHDGTVRLWDLHAGLEVARFTTPCERAMAVDFSPNGLLLAAGYARPTGLVEWYRLNDLRHPVRSEGHDEICRDVRFSADGQALYSAGGDRALRHDLAHARVLAGWHYVGMVQPDWSIDVSDSNAPVILQAGRVMRLTANLSNEKLLFRIDAVTDGGRVRCRGLGPRILVASDRLLHVWDGSPSRIPRQWPAHSGAVMDIAPYPGGRTAFTSGADGLVKHWDLDTGHLLSSFDWGIGEVFSVAVAPDGLTAAAGGLCDIVVWDLET